MKKRGERTDQSMSLYMGLFIVVLAIILQIAEAKVFNFEVKQIISSPDGYQRPCTFVNNTFPGPEIRVQKNEEIVVNLRNSLGTKSKHSILV